MLLLIPGPVTTRPEVRQALTQDIAPWDNDFRAVLRPPAQPHPETGRRRRRTSTPPCRCKAAAISSPKRRCAPSCRPGGRILIPATGAYADRMTRLAREAGRVPVPLPMGLTDATDPQAVARALAADPTLTHVGMVYSETGSGVIHDVQAVGAVVRAAGRRMIVDAVSAFGALPLDLSAQPEIDAAVFTTNKCLEALPGVAFAVARIDRLLACAGNAGSWSFDLAGHLRPCRARRLGQFPVHPAGPDPRGAGRRAGLSRRRGPAGRAWPATPPTCGRCMTVSANSA